MFSNKDVLDTIAMVEKEHLDIRTITMGISLLSCIRDSAEETAQKVYDYVCKKAENIVKTAFDLSNEYGIPIVNKRVSVTPVSILTAAFPEKSILVGRALDKAAETLGKQCRSGVASRELCRLIVLNTASVQIIPMTVCGIRAGLGAESPFDIVPAVWVTSFFALSVGLGAMFVFEKLFGRKE